MKIVCIDGPLDGIEIEQGPYDDQRPRSNYVGAYREVTFKAPTENHWKSRKTLKFRFTGRYENDGETPIYEWSETIDG